MNAPNVHQTNIGPKTLLETLDADFQSIADHIPLAAKEAPAGAVTPIYKTDYYQTFGEDERGERREIFGVELEAVYLGLKRIRERDVPAEMTDVQTLRRRNQRVGSTANSHQMLLRIKAIGNVAGFEFSKVFELEHSRRLNIPGGILVSMAPTAEARFAKYAEPVTAVEIALATAALKNEFVPSPEPPATQHNPYQFLRYPCFT